MLKILPITIFFQFLVLIRLDAQQTNTRAIGRVLSDDNEILTGTTITAIHALTQDKYISIANYNGFFSFFNIKPGGPYTLIFSSIGYDTLKQSNLFVHLGGEHFLFGESEIIDFSLRRKIAVMEELIFSAPKVYRIKSGVETNISAFTLKSMPSISRNFQDFIRMIPQAKVTGDGAMSLAGQNNRFNAFFIDGANNSDLQGNSLTGMNGGQSGASPISIEAIEEINISQAPYDVQYGNFTGGTINAITRSGSNENESSAWYFFRNENLAGRSPVLLEKQDVPGEYSYPRLPGFTNQTIGAWNSGALVKNKLFYFVLFETQSERRPQVFNMAEYNGNSTQQELIELTNFTKSAYHYDPGSFLETKDDLDATRFNIKLDWNVSVKDKLTLTYRFNKAERTAPRLPNSATFIAFQNNGFEFHTQTNSAVFEWKRFIKNNMNNRMLLTYTNQRDARKNLGQLFPTIVMTDGIGNSITLGTDASTGVKLKADDFTFFDALMLVVKKHVFTAGIDISYTTIDNMSMPIIYGQYNYRSVNEFKNMAQPSRYARYFPLKEIPENPARFNTLRGSFFLNDEIRTGTNLKLNFGLRLDMNSIQSKPLEDKFFNDSAVQIISGYYNTAGAVSGQPMNAHWNLSPRIGVDYKLPKYNINIMGGAGIFLGHIVNAWNLDVFNNNNGGNVDVSNPLRFEPDPFHQPTYQELRTFPYRDLMVVARDFKYPTVFRTSFVVAKQFKNRWAVSIEGIFTKNIHEPTFQNINIVPPTRKSAAPDSRNIYSTNSAPDKIVFSSNGVQNPYSGVFLITNNSGKKGSAYSLTFNIQKQAKSYLFNSSYTYGKSSVLFEITGPQTPARSQWRNMETVNGRNYTGLSTSDNALRHRVIAWVTKTFTYSKRKVSTSVSLFYNGQSGSAFSYVYEESMINDNGRRNENFDLIYIPTINELGSMKFLPLTDDANHVLYTAEEQVYYLNSFIENDKYLKNHRGEFSKRNGARLPFTHTIDLKLQQNFIIKLNRKDIGLTITYDVFNFTNMLNRNWGRIYYVTTDSYSLIKFVGFTNTSNLTPQYQFNPKKADPLSLQPSTLPGNSARWISQLGVKININ